MSSTLFRTKNVEQSIQDTEEPEHALRKSLSALDLTVFGVGVIIGTGIFVLTGTAAKNTAGPAVSLSFVVAGVVCALAALCYAEFASTVPVAGSAYTFSYASLGDSPPGSSAGTWCWSSRSARRWSPSAGRATSTRCSTTRLAPAPVPQRPGRGLRVRLRHPRRRLVLVLTAILVLGMKLSARVTSIVVAIKVAVVLVVIIAGAFFIHGANYQPFVPKSQPVPAGGDLKAPLIQLMFGWAPSNFGVMGIFTAAPSSSSRSSASTSSPPPPRRPATRSGTCRAALSARSSSAPRCTWRCRSW